MEEEGGLDSGLEANVAAQDQSQAQAPGGNEVQKQKQNEEEFLRACYLGKDAEVEALATACGTSRVQHARDKKQRHALHLASSSGKTSVVRTLIARYACDADVEDKDGRVPLHFAASQGYTETVSCLCTFGRAWVDLSDGQDDTPLHLAARQGHAETCLELIEQGASSHARNSNGLTPIGEGVIAGHLTVVEALGDLDKACLLDRPNSFSLLHLACGQSQPEVASYLLKKVPSLLDDTHNPQRLSPLHSSVMVRSLPCVRVLIQGGCSLNLQDGNGNSALDLLEEEPCIMNDSEMDISEIDNGIRTMMLQTSSKVSAKSFKGESNAAMMTSAGKKKAEQTNKVVPFLHHLAQELKQCGENHLQQRDVLLVLARKYATDLQGLEACLSKGFPSEKIGGKKKVEVVSALAQSIAEVERIEKALEVLRTLKAAHEDDDIQDALRDPDLKRRLKETNDRENLRKVLMSEEFGMSPRVQSKLQGLRVFFTSRGFTSNAFSKEIIVEAGQEDSVKLEDEKRIKKLEKTMRSVAEKTCQAILGVMGNVGPRETFALEQERRDDKRRTSTSEEDTTALEERGAFAKQEMWAAFKRQMMLSCISLLFTVVLWWMFKKAGKFEIPFDSGMVESIESQSHGAEFDEL
jgi:ankyrin repeat protein